MIGSHWAEIRPLSFADQSWPTPSDLATSSQVLLGSETDAEIGHSFSSLLGRPCVSARRSTAYADRIISFFRAAFPDAAELTESRELIILFLDSLVDRIRKALTESDFAAPK
jgi:hypothetical protein